MRVLILTCNTGGGHNSCAKALQEVFLENGYVCDIADSTQFVSEKLSKFLSWGHTTMYRRIPKLFQFGYGFAEKHPAMLEDEATVYKLLTGGTEHLSAYILSGGYDTVICAHVFSGLLLRQMLKEHPMYLKTAFVATDYTCSPGAAKSALDYYFVPAESLKKEFAEQGVPWEKLYATGIPIRREFYSSGDKRQARTKLGIAPDHTHLLMMCGSMGCGPLERLTKLLVRQLDSDAELSIVCGTNEKLKEELTEKFGAYPNLHIHGFVENMTAMMDSADLYLTKPGGLSTSEALAKGLPMVFIDAVAGCEEYNLNYFLSLGGAVTANAPEELASICVGLLSNKKQLEAMSGCLKAAQNGLPAQKIFDAIKEAAQ